MGGDDDRGAAGELLALREDRFDFDVQTVPSLILTTIASMKTPRRRLGFYRTSRIIPLPAGGPIVA